MKLKIEALPRESDDSFEKKEYTLPPFEIKIAGGSNSDSIKSWLNRGRAVQFLSTGSFDTFISDRGHDEIMRDYAIHDIKAEGYFIIRGGEPDFTHYGGSDEKFKKASEEAILKLIKEKWRL